jgi:hypothetical protein
MGNKIEVRVDNISDTFRYCNSHIDEIGIGNEGCILKIPKVEELSNLAAGTKKRVKLVTPFIAQCHLAAMKKLINEIVEQKLNIILVINDWGILYYLQTLDTSNIEIIVGRFLDWSYSLVPWGKNILRNENAQTVQYAMQSSLFDNTKLLLLKKMKVVGLELNASKENLEFSSKLNELGFSMYIHYGYNIMATTRACPFRKMNEEQNCTEDCNQLTGAVIEEKWIPQSGFKSNANNFLVDKEMKETFFKIYLKNNMVFRRSEFPLGTLLDYEHVNVIINHVLISEEQIPELLQEGEG